MNSQRHFTVDRKPGRKTWRSKYDGLNARSQQWVCLACGRWHGEKPTGRTPTCVGCAGGPLQYFPSSSEARRYASLKLLQDHGRITRLRLQPEFPCVVNGVKVCTYRADFGFYRPGDECETIQEHKGNIESGQTELSKLKRRLAEACYGITITLTEG